MVSSAGNRIYVGTGDGHLLAFGATLQDQAAVVGTDRLVVVVDPEHPWVRRRGQLNAATLAATPLAVQEPGSPVRQALEDGLRKAGTNPSKPAVELGQTAAIKAAVMAGQAPAVLSRLAVEGDVAAGRLLIVEVEGLDLERRLRAVWSASRAPDGPAADLLAVARRAARLMA